MIIDVISGWNWAAFIVVCTSLNELDVFVVQSLTAT